MKKAFTLVEVLIVVAILGILAAIVLPVFRSHSQKAKEAAAKDNLRILRNTIEIYAAQHNGIPPGYKNNDPSQLAATAFFYVQLVVNGHYMNKLPENPFNGNSTLTMIQNGEEFPAEATGQFGWVYQPQTKTIKLDWPGTDSTGAAYFDY